ncbi:MAG: hypothetical protein RPR97_09930, partial [Colwellia sp.]
CYVKSEAISYYKISFTGSVNVNFIRRFHFGEILQPQRLAKRKIMVGYNREAMANCYFSV